ncbi:MAG: carboxypeptidase regulatory-like domain-containing protein [Siphonobacter sp.]
MRTLSILCLLLCLVFQGQATNRKKKSGIKGQITWKSGNQMPSPDRPISSGKGTKRTLWVYELTNQNQTDQQDGFYQAIRTKLVKKVVTDDQGNFKVCLPVGRYSLFTEEPKGLWANITDGQMNIYPVTVEKDKWTEANIEINYAAAF